MKNFIDRQTIQSIMNKEVADVKEIIETIMSISPFGFPGKRTYRVEYVDISGNTQYHIIKGDLYNSTYKKLNDE
tara:strand:- start:5850 stop:6071 length:222 start_codon:yes stop_codon:yes gene_type:complete